jgi:hypothetical protein
MIAVYLRHLRMAPDLSAPSVDMRILRHLRIPDRRHLRIPAQVARALE